MINLILNHQEEEEMPQILFVLFVAVSLQDKSLEVPGKYACSGTNPNGAYEIAVEVQKSEDNYLFSWNKGTMIGLGIRNGDLISVAFVNRLTGRVGIVVYEVKPGQLAGTWSSGGGKTFKEDCIVGSRQAGKAI